MKVTLWGTRGSIAAPGPDTTRYGGNTSCVSVEGPEGTVLVLDAGTGVRRLGPTLTGRVRRIDMLLTHLHMDHIQGFGFFAPLRTAGHEIHVWGPASTTLSLHTRLSRYMSPPLFPVRLRDLPCDLHLHEVPCGEVTIGEFQVTSELVCHPGPTVGFRVWNESSSMAYIPDHEPGLGLQGPLQDPDWTSGYALAKGVDLLIHDGQYDESEYEDRVGWGHSPLSRTFEFAALTGVKKLVPFHHDPGHDDGTLDRMLGDAVRDLNPSFDVAAGTEDAVFEL